MPGLSRSVRRRSPNRLGTVAKLRALKRAANVLTIFAFYSAPTVCPADTGAAAEPAGFQPISHVNKYDEVMYDQSGSKIAILHQIPWKDEVPLPRSIDVYDLTSSKQPRTLIFRLAIPNSVVTDFQWFGNTLFINLFVPPKLPPKPSVAENKDGAISPVETEPYMEVVTFPGKNETKIAPKSIRLFPFHGSWFTDQYSGFFLVEDPLSTMQRYWDSEHSRLKDSLEFIRPIDEYNVHTGKIASVVLPLPPFKSYMEEGTCHPLLISGDGKFLLAWTENSAPWLHEARDDGPFLISVEFKTGKIKVLSSYNEGQKLSPTGSNNSILHLLGEPAVVRSGHEVVARIDKSLVPQRLCYRFGYFNFSGQIHDEVLIYAKDLQSANAPFNRQIVTWTRDGNRIITQGNADVWQYDWGHSKAKLLAKDVRIEGAGGWIDNTHLLVQAYKLSTTPTGNKTANGEQFWAILTVPPL